MKIYIILIVALFFSACSHNSLIIDKQNRLYVKHQDKEYTTKDIVSASKSIRFRDIEVEKLELLSESKEKLFFEQLTTDINYEFKYGSIATIKQIFKVSHTNIVYFKGNLLLIQLEIEPTRYVNLLAETSGTQDMPYVYGFSNSEFKEIATNLGLDKEIKNMVEAYGVKDSITNWNQTDLILYPLVQPVFRRSRF